jgi:hypothetical protein
MLSDLQTDYSRTKTGLQQLTIELEMALAPETG